MSELLAFFQRYDNPAWINNAGDELLVINSPSQAVNQVITQQTAARFYSHLAYLSHDPFERNLSLYKNILLFMPKEKALVELLLSQLQEYIQEDAQLFIIGDKRSGIKSLAKHLPLELYKIEAHSHCMLFQAQFKHSAFQQNIENYYQYYQAEELIIANLPGVFSFQNLDKGTSELLPFLKNHPADSVLDFGCGSGIIACHYQKHFPQSTVDALDANAFAILSTQRTAEKNQLRLNQVFQSNGFSNVEKRYDLIISNPPFHQGQEQTYTVSENLIKQAKNHLKPNGQLLIVANQFLPYEKWLNHCFNSIKYLSETNKFKVILAQ